MKKETILNAIKKLELKIGRSVFRKYLMNHFKRVYDLIMTETKFLDKYNKIVNGKNTLSIFERLYCIEHNLQDRPLCQICGKEHVCGFNLQTNEYKKWCSPRCQASDKKCIEKSKETRKIKYGNENYNGIEKSRQTRLEKNNGKWHDSSFDQKCKLSKIKNGHSANWNNSEKAKDTIAKKIKEDRNYWKDREQKSKETKIKNGHDANWNNRDKFKKTLALFSDDKKKEIIEKRKKSNIERIEYAYPMQNPIIKEEVQKYFFNKYGVKSALQLSSTRQAVRIYKKDKSWERIVSDSNYIPMFSRDEFVSNMNPNKEWNWKCSKCNNIFRSRYDDGHHKVCRVCYPYDTSSHESKYEKEIYDFIISIGFNAERGNRTLINPKELDIYIEQKNLAIEFDGIYWHSELEQKDRKYHLNKTELCENKGFQLIHIFEDEWIQKKDIVLSRLKNILGIYEKTIFARKCEVCEVNAMASIEFQERTHIQGSVNAKVNLGLFYDGKLIALMTFGKPRFNKKYEWELLRFCTELNYHIPGAAGKLLKYFERNYNPKSLISYADRRWSQGKLYKKIGFQLDHISGQDYWYLDINDRLHRYSRYRFQKHKLSKILKNFNKDLSEVENMRNNGYTRIFDCGNLVFVKKY